jgi:hypothetical protein
MTVALEGLKLIISEKIKIIQDVEGNPTVS